MYDAVVLGWIAIAIAILVVMVGVWFLFRSFRRWRQLPPGNDAEAQVAEAELWSTHNMDI